MMRQMNGIFEMLVYRLVVWVAPLIPPRNSPVATGQWFMLGLPIVLGVATALPYYQALGWLAAAPAALVSSIVPLFRRRRALLQKGRHSEWGIQLHSTDELGMMVVGIAWFALWITGGVALLCLTS